MSGRIETVIAEALEPYLFSEDESPVSPTVRKQFAHSVSDVILAALKAASIAVVELPADDAKALEHFEFGGGGVRQYDPSGFGSYRWFSFDEIRTLAPALLAMLAAADAAEASQ